MRARVRITGTMDRIDVLRGSMESLDVTAARAVRHLLADQPTTPAKINFAWMVAAGPQLGRAATVTWMATARCTCSPATRRGCREISRARTVIAERLARLLGPDVVRTIAGARRSAPHVRPDRPARFSRIHMREIRHRQRRTHADRQVPRRLKDFKAPQLGAIVVREAVRRAGIDPESVDECIMGNVVSAGLGQAPARQAALNGGLDDRVAALTINKVCGSGLKAVMLAAQGIATGDIDIAVAGGMESMSNCPYLLTSVREGLRMGDGTIVDSMIHDGLWDSFNNVHMGLTGEHVVARSTTSRASEQDAYAVDSHKKAAAGDARTAAFNDEILPVSIPQKKGDPIVVDEDESIREDTTVEALGRAEAGVQEGRHGHGRQRAGRQRRRRRARRDGRRVARTLSLTPIARIVGQATAGLEPKLVMMTPVEAVRKLADEDRLDDRRRRSVRAQRGVRGAGGRRHARARPRSRAGQRPRRRRRARPPDRRQRRARADHAALRAEAPRQEARHRDAVPRRRQRRRAGGGVNDPSGLGRGTPLEHSARTQDARLKLRCQRSSTRV